MTDKKRYYNTISEFTITNEQVRFVHDTETNTYYKVSNRIIGIIDEYEYLLGTIVNGITYRPIDTYYSDELKRD